MDYILLMLFHGVFLCRSDRFAGDHAVIKRSGGSHIWRTGWEDPQEVKYHLLSHSRLDLYCWGGLQAWALIFSSALHLIHCIVFITLAQSHSVVSIFNIVLSKSNYKDHNSILKLITLSQDNLFSVFKTHTLYESAVICHNSVLNVLCSVCLLLYVWLSFVTLSLSALYHSFLLVIPPPALSFSLCSSYQNKEGPDMGPYNVVSSGLLPARLACFGFGFHLQCLPFCFIFHFQGFSFCLNST